MSPEKREEVIVHMAAGLLGAYRYFRQHWQVSSGAHRKKEKARTGIRAFQESVVASLLSRALGRITPQTRNYCKAAAITSLAPVLKSIPCRQSDYQRDAMRRRAHQRFLSSTKATAPRTGITYLRRLPSCAA